MFSNYISNRIYKDNNSYYFKSSSPISKKWKYYKEIKFLSDNDIIRVVKPYKREMTSEGWIFTGTVYEVLDKSKIDVLAKKETYKTPIQKGIDGKLITIVNELNLHEFADGMNFIKFNKGRANSAICNTHETDGSRQFYLDSVLGEGKWGHYDVPSSIPQIIHLMNFKKWYGKRVWDELGNGTKYYAYSLIFCATDFNSAKSVYKRMIDEGTVSKDCYRNYCKMTSRGWETEAIHKIKGHLQKIVGPLPKGEKVSETKQKRNELFIHESNVYLMVLQELYKRNIKCYKVYDSFYYDKTKITENELVAIIKEKAEFYANNYDSIMEAESSYWKTHAIAELEEIETKHKRQIKNKPSVRMNNVYKWFKRNPGKTDYPKKWTVEEIEYVQKLQSK